MDATARRALKKIWDSMIRRCTDPRVDRYPNYGGRGIKVCDRWRDSFDAFVEDMGERPSSDYSIDRIDVNGNYEPGNVRWLPKSEQPRNQTKNVWITACGRTMLMVDWARELGCCDATIHGRLKRGWSQERAVTVPADSRRGHGDGATKVTAFGKTMRISEWSRESGLPEHTIRHRIKVGWPAERAVSESTAGKHCAGRKAA